MCYFAGVVPLLVGVAAIILFLLHAIQLRSLYAYLRKRTPHSSEYHNRPTHIFWRMVCMIIAILCTVRTYVLVLQYLRRVVYRNSRRKT